MLNNQKKNVSSFHLKDYYNSFHNVLWHLFYCELLGAISSEKFER